MKTHQMKIRIYYQDTDAGGIVYHSNYLDFAERARSEMMYEMGISNKILLERGIAFVIRHADLEYLSPARLEDELTLITQVDEIKNASMNVTQTFYRNEQKLVIVRLQVAFIDPNTIRPVRLPADLKALFEEYKGETL